MTAKGKINASNVNETHRIIVRTHLPYNGESCSPSRTKTGDDVQIVRVLDKIKTTNRRGYLIVTSAGTFYAEPIQTMWLAPEDAAGIKRARAEALAADEAYDRMMAKTEAVLVERRELTDETPAAEEPQEAPAADLTDEKRAEQAQEENLDELPDPDGSIEPSPGQERTGSAVVKLMERVWDRIRQNHPELPQVVIVTGAGTGPGSNKWGHFRADGWTAKAAAEEGAKLRMHELFMAGETLAKGAKQVLQTMLHEGAHTLARVRSISDTSRQGRWHNKEFRKLAEEMGLHHPASQADKTHGYSFVNLTTATLEEYGDLLAELDREIHLMVSLPGWLGGESDEDEKGGELIGKKPPTGEGKSSNNLKLTCGCAEPNIIRASRKVADKLVVKCDDCDELFGEKSD